MTKSVVLHADYCKICLIGYFHPYMYSEAAVVWCGVWCVVCGVHQWLGDRIKNDIQPNVFHCFRKQFNLTNMFQLSICLSARC